MEYLHTFIFDKNHSSEQIQILLEGKGFHSIVELDSLEDKKKIVYALNSKREESIAELSDIQLAEFSWEDHWKIHCPLKDFQLDLRNYGGGIIELLPGPGFGDLSHPTTALCLELLLSCPSNNIIDVGCGCGILTFAALSVGKNAYGYDIDSDAIAHAHLICEKNGFDKSHIGLLPPDMSCGRVIVANMILSEMREALSSLPLQGSELICSGILIEEKEKADEYLSSIGFYVTERHSKEGWMAYKAIWK